MEKKPKTTLTLVNEATTNSTPATLGQAGAKLWQSIKGEYRIDDAGGQAMLLQICKAEDRANEWADTIASDGPMIRTKTGFKDHPLIKHELAARSFIVRSLHRLGLDIEPTRDSVGRPSGTHNQTR
jgi:hypothetical protein